MSDFTTHFKYHYKILKKLGVFFDDDSPKWLSILRTSTVYIIHTIITIQGLYDLHLVRHDLDKLSFNICMSGLSFGLLLRNFLFLYAQQMFVEVHQKVDENRQFIRDSETDQICFEEFTKIKRITFLFNAMALVATVCWLSMPFLEEEFSLPIEAWFPFEIKKYPNFYFAYLSQVWIIWYILVGLLFCDYMSFNFLGLIHVHYRILTHNITKIDDFIGRMNEKPKLSGEQIKHGLKQHLKSIILHHRQTIRFVKEYESIVNPMLLIQFSGGTLLICGIVVETLCFADKLSTKLFAELLLLIGVAVNLFVFCFFGTALEYASYNISTVVYNTKWYDYKEPDTTLKVFILLLCGYSQRPYKVRAAKIISINYNTFLTVWQAVYNTVALCQHVATDYKVRKAD